MMSHALIYSGFYNELQKDMDTDKTNETNESHENVNGIVADKHDDSLDCEDLGPTQQKAQAQSTYSGRSADRYRAHVLAELKKYRWIPFFSTYSGVIIDLSDFGMKFSFSAEVDIKPFTSCFVRIPLASLNIEEPRMFEANVEVKWFDQKKYKMGALFINLNASQKKLLKKMISALNEKNAEKVYDKRKKNKSYLPNKLS